MCADARGDCPVSCAIVLYHSFEKGALTEPGAKLVASRSNGSTALGTGVCFSHGFWGSEIRSLGLYSRCFYLGLNFFSSSPFLSPPPPSPPLPSHSLPSCSLRPPSLLSVCIYVCVCTWESILFLYLVGLRDRTWVSRWWHLYTLSYLICPGFTFKDMCAFYTLAKRSRSNTLLTFVWRLIWIL